MGTGVALGTCGKFLTAKCLHRARFRARRTPTEPERLEEILPPRGASPFRRADLRDSTSVRTVRTSAPTSPVGSYVSGNLGVG